MCSLRPHQRHRLDDVRRAVAVAQVRVPPARLCVVHVGDYFAEPLCLLGVGGFPDGKHRKPYLRRGRLVYQPGFRLLVGFRVNGGLVRCSGDG